MNEKYYKLKGFGYNDILVLLLNCMKQLVLIRHAKSEHLFGVSDFERNITEQGAQAAKLTAKMAGPFFSVNPLIWCSPAARTQATAAIFKELYTPFFNNFHLIADLYTFSMEGLVQVIQTAPDTCNQLVVFGHNEGITDFVNTFGDIYLDNVPTSGLVPIIFDTPSWSMLRNGRTGSCLFPKQLFT